MVGASGKDGPTPLKLTLAGVVISALLGSWTSALVLLDEQTMDVARFWMAGSVAGRPLEVFWWVSPFLLVGTAGCLLMGHQLNVMSMGDETARCAGHEHRPDAHHLRGAGGGDHRRGHGGRWADRVRRAGGAAHGAGGDRADYRWILAYSVLVGAIFLTVADILGRVVLDTGELQVGIVTALVGAPFLDLPRPREQGGDVDGRTDFALAQPSQTRPPHDPQPVGSRCRVNPRVLGDVPAHARRAGDPDRCGR